MDLTRLKPAPTIAQKLKSPRCLGVSVARDQHNQRITAATGCGTFSGISVTTA